LGEARTGPTAKRETDVMDNLLQPQGASREGGQNAVGKTSAKIFRLQAAASHQKRRTTTWSSTRRPPSGRSAARRW
jgi:hypothetical protein